MFEENGVTAAVYRYEELKDRLLKMALDVAMGMVRTDCLVLCIPEYISYMFREVIFLCQYVKNKSFLLAMLGFSRSDLLLACNGFSR